MTAHAHEVNPDALDDVHEPRTFLVTTSRTHGENRATTHHVTRVVSTSPESATECVMRMHRDHESHRVDVVDVREELPDHDDHDDHHESTDERESTDDQPSRRRRTRLRGASAEEFGPLDD